MMRLSYRQTKRLDQAQSSGGGQRAEAQKRGAGVEPKEAGEIPGTSVAFGGQEVFWEEGERFGPTLAAEHLESDDRVEVNAQTALKAPTSALPADGSALPKPNHGSAILGSTIAQVFWPRWRYCWTVK